MSDNINVLTDMTDMRDGMNECASLGTNDVNEIFDNICLNGIENILIVLRCLFVWNKDIIITYDHTVAKCKYIW